MNNTPVRRLTLVILAVGAFVIAWRVLARRMALPCPSWIAGMLDHGHRGVAEIAQGVDALYAFAATADAVSGSLFDATHAALIADEAVLAAMLEKNREATAAISARLRDALERGLWVTRRNSVASELERAQQRARA